MKGANRDSLESRVLVLAPTVKDAELSRAILARSGIECLGCLDLVQLCEQLTEGAGAVLVAEEAIQGGDDGLNKWLRQQPLWSDLPVLILARAGANSVSVARAMEGLGNVTILERPTRVAALVSVVRTALRARQRQYQLRDQLAQRERFSQQLEMAMAAANAGSWQINLATGEFSASDRVVALHGLPPGTHLNREQALACVHPEDRADIEAALQQTFEFGKPFRHEHRVPQPDGSVRWVVSHAERRGEGDQACIIGLVQDVTEQKQAEQARLESERNYRALAVASSEIAYRMSADWSTMLPLDGRQLVASSDQPLEDWAWMNQNLPPDEHPRVRQAICEAIDRKSLFELEHRVRRRDGSIGWTFSRAVPILDENEAVITWFGAASDITERKRAEADRQEAQGQVVTTLESIAEAFTRFDRDWRVAYLNDAAERMNQRSRADTLGKTIWELFPALIGTKLEAEYRRCVAEQVSVAFDYNYEPFDNWVAIKCYPTPEGGLIVFIRDITEPKKAQERLRQSEARFRAGIEAVSDIVWTNDARGRMAGEQLAWGNFTGQTLESYQGYGWSNAIHSDDAQPTLDAWNEAVAGKKNFTFKHRIRRRDGHWRLCTVRAVPMFDGRGDVSEWVGVHTDVTDQMETLEALRVSEEQRRMALEAAELGTWHVDPLTRLTQTDERFRAIFGTTDEWVDYLQLFSVMHPDDLPAVEAAVTAATRPDDPQPYAIEYRIVRPDGTTRWVFAKGRATHEEGELGRRAVRFDGTVMDITERKRADEALRASEARLGGILRRSPAGIIQTDAAGRMTLVNPRWCEMTGHPEAELLGRNILEITDSSFVAPTADAFGRLVAGGPDFQIEKAYCRKDGSVLRAQSNVAAIRSPSGEFLGLIAVILDISERLNSEGELRRLAAELSEADRRKDVFMATLAHELRNPLAPIRNGLQVMKLAKNSGAAVEQVRAVMDRQVSQMVRLVDDLLDVSRITQGKMELRKERVELRAVIDAAVETSRPTIDEAGHELTVVVADEPIFVDGDPIRLSQIVSNLLNNSAKYTHRGGHLRLTAGWEGATAVVSVKDNGIGIPPAMMDKVFVMFAQVDREMEKTTGGLGIGLSLVKGLVEMHGGTIVASSDGEGMGSEFVVRLPVVTTVVAAPELPNGQTSDVVPSTVRRILVVDDNEDAADMLSEMLEMLGNEVRTANDGEAGIEVAAQFRPDVVLMDIGMPKLDGHEAARRIRQYPWGGGMVLVALTGWGQKDDRKKSSDAGFDHHLVKPVDLDVLLKLLAGLKPSAQPAH